MPVGVFPKIPGELIASADINQLFGLGDTTDVGTTAESIFPKVDGDTLFPSEANSFAGFGNGKDGAFSESAGTTNLTQGTIHQFTTFLLDTSATLSATTNSKLPIIILVQGDVTINGTISLGGLGNDTFNGYYPIVASNATNVIGAGCPAENNTGGQSCPPANFQLNQNSIIMNGTQGATGGSSGSAGLHFGGGGGSSSVNDGSGGGNGSGSNGGGTAGVSGDGGCTIIFICGGNVTFGASSTADTSGQDGGNASSGNAGGGGGGGGGDFLFFHNGTKTDNGLTTDVTGGSGGTQSGSGGVGGSGGAGQEKIVQYDTIFWGK